MSTIVHSLPESTLLSNWFMIEGSVVTSVFILTIIGVMGIKTSTSKDFEKSLHRPYIYFSLNAFVLSISNSLVFIASTMP